MEEYTPEMQETKMIQFKRWFQDNLRIIVSVVIVVAIAGGIYSYSKRGQVPVVSDQAVTEKVADTQNSTETKNEADNQKSSQESGSKKEVSPAATSQETENSFVETAGKGDGLTLLARRAAANYLEKNPDSSLTKEHKIFIEDFLRKNVGHKGGVKVGTSVDFSKDLIQKAVDQSKKLNDKQLNNLKKFSARVSTL